MLPPRPLRLLLALPLLSLAACGLNVFNTEVEGQATIPGSAVGQVLGEFPAMDGFTGLDFDANQEFRNQGVRKEQVDSVKVTSLTLRVVSPSGQTLDFLDEISFFAKEGDREVLVAQARNIQGVGAELPLEVTGAELRDFVAAPSMSIIARGQGKPPAQDTQVEARVGLRVEVNPTGGLF